MNPNSQIRFEDYDIGQELSSEPIVHQGESIVYTKSVNRNDETARNLPSFQSTFINRNYPNIIPIASPNRSYEMPNLGESFQIVEQPVSIHNTAQNNNLSIHNCSELIDISNNVQAANLLFERSEVSQQKDSPINAGFTLQQEKEIETGENTFLRALGSNFENLSIDSFELEGRSISRVNENICPDCGNSFIPRTKTNQLSVVLSDCICCENIHRRSSNETNFIHTEDDVLSVAGPSHSQLFICDNQEKSFPKKPSLQRNRLNHERNTCFNSDPEVALSTGTQQNKDIDAPRNSFLKTHFMVHTNLKTTWDVPGNSSHEDLESYVASSSELKKHICPECGKACSSKSKLEIHCVVHTGEKPFVCDICPRAYTQKSSLNRHKLTHNRNKFFKCNICAKQFNQEISLKKHVEVHTKRFKCDICQKRFFFKDGLTVHKLKHKIKKSFKCDFCGKEFSHQWKLKIHSFGHSDIKRYKCDICPKSFVFIRDVKRHKVSHTKEKRFKCSVCGKYFGRNDTLRSHSRVHKGNEQNTLANE